MNKHNIKQAEAPRVIQVRGAYGNNLRSVDVDIPLGTFTVITGVSGSGKSTLAFDTIYAEGQRRYVETFSAYTRQFLDRMDKPKVSSIDGIPPAIAVDQTNPVRTSRSTVGTMTELNDHFKLLWAKCSILHCAGCGRPVRRETPDSVFEVLLDHLDSGAIVDGARAMVLFTVPVPPGRSVEEMRGLLADTGYHRIDAESESEIVVVGDRLLLARDERSRWIEAIEAAFLHGSNTCTVRILDGPEFRFSRDLHCPDCDIHYQDAGSQLFSFNSPVGACDTCRGFGRTMGIDYGLVIPDESKSLREGAVRVWESKSYLECRDDLLRFAGLRGVDPDVPWRDLSDQDRRWVLEGEGEWDDGVWYGVRRFFAWLESRSYKMHIRVLLSRYRSYDLCPACHGARLKPQALQWKIRGRSIHDVMQMPIWDVHAFFGSYADELVTAADPAAELVLSEIQSRLGYLVEVGVGYLTLDRQSRTLSGGEVQRINLTTALGTQLTNTLFVLDEPSIGLHSRDVGRLVGILRRLRDAGNTLLVVEHDPQVVLAADRVIEMGPGAGTAGGTIIFEGSPRRLLESGSPSARSLLIPPRPALSSAAGSSSQVLSVRGATAHNLQSVDVDIPLHRFVCLTGVSGSGKSTLLETVLYRAMLRHFGKQTETPGEHEAISGAELLDDIVLVDQSPIGKTARSNPASYVGAFDEIRKRFAALPQAKKRGYTPGTFSFNSGNGRCPTCGGTGFEHIEMQFLSDIYLRCPDCEGARYRSEILELRMAPSADAVDLGHRSIAEVLELTVADAARYFADDPKVLRVLQPLVAVGLDYVALGQPLPTLSGGESQRLKLAYHLVGALGSGAATTGTLFLFDEPTTGLHATDIATLLSALRTLVEAGNSVLVIEHNLDVVAACDYVIDMGPDGGSEGGRVVVNGSPSELIASGTGYTAAALEAYLQSDDAAASGSMWTDAVEHDFAAEASPGFDRPIEVVHAREHNLREISVSVPQNQLTVLTGVSGSGKSTLAFDILFAEGQRRYLESLNAYARQFVQPASRPDVDAVHGLPPSVAIEQRMSRGGWKSTVATTTELFHFLRLLFLKLGVQYCPDCDIAIQPQTADAIVADVFSRYRDQSVTVLAPLVVARKGYYTDLAEWARKHGYAELRVDGEYLPTDGWPRLSRYQEHSIDLPVGSLELTTDNEQALRTLLTLALSEGDGQVRVVTDTDERMYSTNRSCPSCSRSFPDLDPRLFSFNSRHGMCSTCNGTGFENYSDEDEHPDLSSRVFDGELTVCPDCDGSRLNEVARAVRFRDRDIASVAADSVQALSVWMDGISLSDREEQVARDIVSELRVRLGFLEHVGLGYLGLDRAAPTLSGGEAQRIRLAAQLGSNLRGVCYVLDEPTIGLHTRDNRMLLDTLMSLRDKGNTVVVVEHDEATIRSADRIIDLGPGGGTRGGMILGEGSVDELLKVTESVTAQILACPPEHPTIPREDRDEPPISAANVLTISGAYRNNLKEIDVQIPLGRLVCLTGVSGSGKSSLARGVVFPSLRDTIAAGRTRASRRKSRTTGPVLIGCAGLSGHEVIDRVLEVDQTPIGKTPRSCPATYVGIWDEIRKLYAQTPEARIHGYTASRFSFNTSGGRCENCGGQGMVKIEMNFLPDVRMPCEQCGGARFDEETRNVRYKGASVSDVLDMSVEDAVGFFSAHPKISYALELMDEVGLGYLKLGQQSPTLSGGEAQRVKLVTELSKTGGVKAGHTLYVLDEPTIGLHMADVGKLTRVLLRLVDAGNSVLVVEHNLDLIAESDHVIDLGPEAGEEGGTIVSEGAPAMIARGHGYTAQALAGVFARNTSHGVS
ncbi:MAG: excinuclease ABC subunit A [Spirochaetaceae bacterium]|nr:MAG: excinuclease ABC subunit A [Spirochaetaceae bacterium]